MSAHVCGSSSKFICIFTVIEMQMHSTFHATFTWTKFRFFYSLRQKLDFSISCQQQHFGVTVHILQFKLQGQSTLTDDLRESYCTNDLTVPHNSSDLFIFITGPIHNDRSHKEELWHQWFKSAVQWFRCCSFYYSYEANDLRLPVNSSDLLIYITGTIHIDRSH